MKSQMNLFGDICRVITDSIDPGRALDTMVHMMAERLGMDVCSVYLLNVARSHLELRATAGLTPASVGSVRMGVGEGLTGMVLEKLEPVLERNPSAHPRFKYFEESREERFRTFLGLPLVHHRNPLGVVVFQTLREDGISETDLPFFRTLSSQIASTAAYGGFLESGFTESLAGGGRKSAGTAEDRMLLRGDPVSAGFGEGYACFLENQVSFDQVSHGRVDDAIRETSRFERALQKSEEEMARLMDHVSDLSSQDKAILDTHVMLLRDPSFRNQVKDFIGEGLTAEYALKKIVLKHVDFFLSLEDPYLRDRGADVEDMGKRVLRSLVGHKGQVHSALERPTILVASDISPVDMVELMQPNLMGIILSKGGKTSHTVILARSLEIPMVIGAKRALEFVKPEDPLILDGHSGLVFRKPTREIIDGYAHLREEKKKSFQALSALKHLPAETTDGLSIRLGANMGLISDVALSEKYGADHIGLYRTEFPFMVRKEFPSEEVQVDLYRRVLEAAGGKSVTIRTLDVGGDKFLSCINTPKERNPSLGWRSVRVLLELDDIFRTQIRSILRASALGKVKLLFPMISSVQEIRKIREIIEEEKEVLTRKGLAYDPGIKVGIMVEVPAAVIILDRLMRYADFASIGTNDLIQYTIAVDRSSEKVASMYTPFHPAVISLISQAVKTCREMGKKVGICGEAAANPLCAYLFLGMGVGRLSMNPASLLGVKNMIRNVSFEDAQASLNRVLLMEDAGEVASFLEGKGISEYS